MMYKRYTPLGINVDVDPVEVGDNVWTDSLNMVPRVGKMERALGYQEVFPTPLFPPYFLMSTPQLGAPHWIYAGASQIGVINSTGAHTEVTPAGGLPVPVAENGWSGCNLNGVAVVNSLENGPYYWFDGIAGGLATELPGQRAGTRYNVMRSFKYHLIGLGVSDGSGDFLDALHWSDAADPGTVPASWVPTTENEAGDNTLSDERGAIVDGLTLRDAFYIYKQDSVYEMVYVGGNNVFSFRKVFGTVGALAPNCVARVKGSHVVLGNGDIYRHDGQNIESLIDGKARDRFFATLDDQYFQNSFVVYLEPREEVWFCVPTTGNTRPNLALVWNVTTNALGYRIIPDADFAASGVIGEVAAAETWEDQTQTWDASTKTWFDQTISQTEDAIMIADAVKQKFFLGNSTPFADGEAYRARVSKFGMSLDDPTREKAIRRIWPRINADPNTTFKMDLINQRDPMAGTELLGTVEFKAGTEGVAVNVNARYLGLRIYSDDASTWDIAGVDIGYMPRGNF